MLLCCFDTQHRSHPASYLLKLSLYDTATLIFLVLSVVAAATTAAAVKITLHDKTTAACCMYSSYKYVVYTLLYTYMSMLRIDRLRALSRTSGVML